MKISGDQLPIGRTVQTGANGMYQFEYLLPGEYTIEIDKAGIGRARRAAIVEVGKDTQVDVVLGLTVTEELTVTAASPIVDVRSTEVSFNFNADTLNSLPLERTYRGLFQLIPGVADNRSTVGPAAGGSRQDNTYLIDGANITNPGFGYLSTEVNELDIAEVNLKRAGISAEFGRTERHGDQRGQPQRLESVFGHRPDRLAAGGSGERVPAAGRSARRRRQARHVPRPAADDRDGTSRRPRRPDRAGITSSSTDRPATSARRSGIASTRSATPLPDEVRTGPEFYGKLTAAPTASHQLTVSYRHRPSHVDNAGLDSDFAPSVATTTDNGSRIATAEWANFMAARRSLNVRYLYMKENNEDVPVTDLGLPAAVRSGQPVGDGPVHRSRPRRTSRSARNQFTNIQNYRRHEVRGTFSQFFDIGRSSHALKAGAGYEFGEETFNRLANGWGTIANITQNGVPALRTRYFTPQPPQLGQGRTYSLFVQDDVTIANRTSVNVGVLLNRDEFSQNVDGSGGCPATVALKGGAAVYESNGDTCTLPPVRLRRRNPAAPRRQLSAARRDRATRRTRTGAATTTWIRNRAAAAWRRAASSRRRRSSI